MVEADDFERINKTDHSVVLLISFCGDPGGLGPL